MLNVSDYDWSIPGAKQNKINENKIAKAIAFVIEEEVVETLAADEDFCNLLLTSSGFKESSIQDDVLNNAYYVDVLKDSEVIETIMCNEKIQAILLSEPSIYDLLDQQYENGKMIVPGCKYISGQFVISERL
jgi:hypothetical protein